MKTSEKKLSIIIVNFNSGEYLYKCLNSLNRLKKEVDFDIWVVDNNSTDKSLSSAKKNFPPAGRQGPKVKYIENYKNIGFGKANNVAISKITSEYILFLNPDSMVPAGTLKYMVNFLENNTDVGAASCKVEKKDGSLDWASHRSFPSPFVAFQYFILKDDRVYHLKGRDFNIPHEVDVIVGAFFLVRKKVLDEVGGFDKDFFMFGEDIDLCFRIKEAGYKIMYVPEVKVLHFKGVSTGLKKHSQEITKASIETKKRSIDDFYHSMKIFYEKHYRDKYPFFINWLVFLGIHIKWWLAKERLTV